MIIMMLTKIARFRRESWMSNIFSSYQIKKVMFKNRIVMAPMVRFGFPCSDGIMGDMLIREYLEYCDQEIGLLISQSLSISASDDPMARSAGTSGGAGAYSKRHIPYLQQLADRCHRCGSRFFVQLGKGGYDFSAFDSKDVNTLTIADLERIRDDFINAVYICFCAGADGVELHGAHGFFLNMMTSAEANRRSDKYGGDLYGRLTFAREIVDGIQKFADDHFILSYRMGWTNSLEEDIAAAQAFEDIGIEMLHVSHGIPQTRSFHLPADYEYSSIVYAGSSIKPHIHIPIITVWGIDTLARGNVLVEHNSCDFVAYGRAFLADPSFVVRSMENMNYRPCLGCKTCRWFTDGRKCPARIMRKKNPARR